MNMGRLRTAPCLGGDRSMPGPDSSLSFTLRVRQAHRVSLN